MFGGRKTDLHDNLCWIKLELVESKQHYSEMVNIQ